MKFFVSWLAASFVPIVSGMATLALPTSANCGDQAVLTCTSTDCYQAYAFFRENVTIYNHIGPQNGADPERYSGTIISNGQVQLIINKIKLSDAVMYTCKCGFDLVSVAQTLQYQCKATTSKATITNEKKLSIAVDSLYPQPSRVDTSLTSQINQLPGTYTCGSSPTLASHYTCTWKSTASLPDGNHGYTLTVTTLTEASPPVSGSFKIVTPTSPSISKLVTISTNRPALIGIQDTPLTIQCVSSGGIPAPTLAWYRGNTSTHQLAQSSTSDSVQQSDGTYTVTLTHIFTPRRTDDLTTVRCQVFYPGATNGASPNPSPVTALLYLDLRPDNSKVMQTGEAISGGSMSVQCTSTNGRPAPSITWSYKGQTFTATNTPIYNQTSDTFTVMSVLQRPVNAADNGQTATCMVSHITLSVPLTETINVDVKFGPSTGSTTVSGNLPTPAIGHNQIQLNCTSGSSNPATNITWYNGSNVISNVVGYKRWSGDNNGVVTSDILTITPTRYMDGARITCRSDNGYGADSTYVDLDILYSPLIQPLLNITSTEGEPDVSLTCLASSKPPATFTWNKGVSVLATGTGTLTHNSFSYVIPRVGRSDAGSYQCKADNDVGSSDLKNVYLIVKYPSTASTASPPAALIGGTVGATCALLVLAVVLVVVWRIRKGGWMFSQKTDRRSHAKNQDTTESVVECAMYVTAENVQPVISKKDVYSTPQKRERSDPPANVYAVVSKTKKGKDKDTASTTEDNKGGKKRRKPGKPTEGLPECPHVAETTLDTRNTPTYNPPMRSMKNANADGLIYADLEFDGTVKNGVVHGLDNVTIYEDIDNTKRAEPFADSDIEST